MRGRLIDPDAELNRFVSDRLGIKAQKEIEREIDDLRTYGTPRERTLPRVTGSRSDGTALLSLIKALEEAGYIEDKTVS